MHIYAYALSIINITDILCIITNSSWRPPTRELHKKFYQELSFLIILTTLSTQNWNSNNDPATSGLPPLECFTRTRRNDFRPLQKIMTQKNQEDTMIKHSLSALIKAIIPFALLIYLHLSLTLWMTLDVFSKIPYHSGFIEENGENIARIVYAKQFTTHILKPDHNTTN